MSFKNPYLASIPVTGVSAVSSYSAWNNLSLASTKEHNYLARIQLDCTNSNNNCSFGSSEEFSLSDRNKIDEALLETKNRLSDFYKGKSKDIQIDLVKNSSNQNSAELFLHLRTPNEEKNVNRLWFEQVRLNQLSIDRYGYEFDEQGAKKSDSSNPKLHKLVDWKNVDLDGMAYEGATKEAPEHISFNVLNKSIPKSEIQLLTNSDENKYKEDANNNEISKDWLVWVDKDVLVFKINYILQSYVFGKTETHANSTITSIIGNSSSRSDDQRTKYNAVLANSENLKESEKKFAQEYITQYINSGNETISDWSKVVTNISTPSSFVTSEQVNKIYNKFSKLNKDLTLFNDFLVTKITSGASGNWKQVFDAEIIKTPEKKPEEEIKPASSEQKDLEIKDVEAINSSSSEDQKNQNRIKIISDNNPLDNKGFVFGNLFKNLKEHSVKFFSLKTQKTTQNNSGKEAIYPSSVYTSSTNPEEVFYVLHYSRDNEFGIHKNFEIPALMGLLFLISVFAYLIKSFKGPGGIFAAGIVCGTINVLGTFFFLGAKLSMIGVAGMIVGILYALFLSNYILGFLRKIFTIEFLDKDNTFVTFKRGIIFASDVSLPMFILSTLISFFAPIHLREFGIVLSLCVFWFFLLIPIVCCYSSLQYVKKNFLQLINFYRSSKNYSDSLLCQYACNCSVKQTMKISAILVFVLLLGGILFCSVGFQSFSFLKNNYLVSFAVDAATSINAPYSILSSGSKNKGYLVSGSFDFSSLSSSVSNPLYVLETNIFSEQSTLYSLFIALFFAFLLISVYVFIRFKFKNLFILWGNSFISFAVLSSLFLICRVPVYSSVFLGIFMFFAAVIMYHIFYFNMEKNKEMSWFERISKDMSLDVLANTRNVMFIFLLLSLFSANEPLIFASIYMFISLACVHYLSSFLYFLSSNKLEHFKTKYMWQKEEALSEDGEELYEEQNLDKYDEELILGINKSF